MAPTRSEIDPTALADRLERLDGVAELRAAAVAAAADAYLVGGSVRDLLAGRERADLDVAVEGDAAALAERLGPEVRSHERFGTASVAVAGHRVDVAATRAEAYPRPGALPEVRPAPLADDLARRDFTVNAMAVPLRGEPTLIDPHGGLDDLRNGILRDLHPGSFGDDPTRALRAARYAARLGLEPEAGTLARLRRADLGAVSADRIDAELRRLAGEGAPRRGFELLAGWGLIELPPGAGALVDAVAAVAARPEWAELDRRSEAILAAARGEEAGSDLARSEPDRPSEAVELARGRGAAELLLARARGAEWLDRYVAEWRRVRPAIDGHDLISAGVPEGPAIGRGLAAALAARLDGAARGRDAELEVALAAASAGDG